MQQKPQFVAVALYSKDYEGSSVPLAVDRIVHRWDFPKGRDAVVEVTGPGTGR